MLTAPTPPFRLVALALVGLAPLAGCAELGLSLRPPPAPVPAPSAERTFDLPEAYDILDVRYDADLVAADSSDLREWSTVQVFARHRETGEEALFVYDFALDGAAPASVIRFRRTAPAPTADEAPEAAPAPVAPRRQW